MGKWNELSSEERQYIFDDIKTWNIGHKKGNNSRREPNPPPSQNDMNRKIKKLQARLDDRKKRLKLLSDTATDSDENSFDYSD